MTIVCKSEKTIDIDGIFTINDIQGVDKYNFENIFEKELIVNTKNQFLFDEQPTQEFTINNEEKTFTLALFDEETEAPTIYSGKDKSLEISCEKNGDSLLCTPTIENMPESKAYLIHYKDSCGNLQSTGVIVNNVIEEEGRGEITIETKGNYISIGK